MGFCCYLLHYVFTLQGVGCYLVYSGKHTSKIHHCVKNNFCLQDCFIISTLLSPTYSGLWLADYLYGYLFKTYRLDLVEFTPLPDESGVQMLWRNPPGFNANSGEYVQIKLPWLSEGGQEWHPFSIYLKERTERGKFDDKLHIIYI